MCGDNTTKAKAVKKGRNPEFVRTLVTLSDQITDGLWVPNGVGSNLLTILTDILQLDEVNSREFESSIPLYDISGQVSKPPEQVIQTCNVTCSKG